MDTIEYDQDILVLWKEHILYLDLGVHLPIAHHHSLR